MIPFLAMILNSAMFSVALPVVRDTFVIAADSTAWLVTTFTLPYIILMPLYGRLGDRLGKRRLFLVGMSVFLVGTLINLVSRSLALLILGRCIQGIGASSVNPLCLAIISEIFSVEERGKALVTWNSIGPIAIIVGPLMAGYMIEHLGFRSLFALVLVAGAVAIWAVRTFVPLLKEKGSRSGFLLTFDWLGVLLLGTAVSLLAFYVSSRPITGVEALRDWRLGAPSLGFFIGFYFWERKHRRPFVDLRIFSYRNFRRASLCAGLRMFTMLGLSFLLPLYLTDVYGLRAFTIGIVTMVRAAGLLPTIRLGGMLTGRWPRRRLVSGSIVLQLAALFYLALMSGASLGWIIAGIVVHSMAAGLALVPLHNTAVSDIPQQQLGFAAGLYSMMRFSGSMLGATINGVLLKTQLDLVIGTEMAGTIKAYQTGFFLLAAVNLIGIAIGWRLRD
jgi:EmrB/QacA subfamily drug resistance transporter